MKKCASSIYIIIFLQLFSVPFIVAINQNVQSSQNLHKLSNQTKHFSENQVTSKTNFKKKSFLSKNSTNPTNSTIIKNVSNSNHTTPQPEKKEIHIASNISNATLLNLLIEQTELMKTEICKSNVDIGKGLEKLMSNIDLVKKKLKQITSVSVIAKEEIILDFTVAVNNLNLITAELNKMSTLIENIKKANCKELVESQKKYDEVKNHLNKLVESIQNFLRKTNLDFNLLILT